MKRDLGAYVPALVALAVLVLVVAQTLEAFQRADRLGARPHGRLAADPYARLEKLLGDIDQEPPPDGLRDPFSGFRAAVITQPVVVKPVVAARPVVTAILSDGNAHSAIVRFEGHSYTVKAGDLFAGFTVVDIDGQQVVLDNGRERMALQVQTKGK